MTVIREVVKNGENSCRSHFVNDALAARSTRPGCPVEIPVDSLNNGAHGVLPVRASEAVENRELLLRRDPEHAAVHVATCATQKCAVEVAIDAQCDRLRIPGDAVKRVEDCNLACGRHFVHRAKDRSISVSSSAIEEPVHANARGSVG